MEFDPTGIARKLDPFDQMCRDYENARVVGSTSLMAAFLDRLPQEDRAEGMLALIAIDLEIRLARNEDTTVEVYRGQFPNELDLVERCYHQVQNELATSRSVRQRPQNGLPQNDHAPSLPKQIGDFRILREVGRGGMGLVYEAVQESLGRRVALKVLATNAVNRQMVNRFEREARAIARLHHSHIVEVYGGGENEGLPYLAMQFVDGAGLDQVIRTAKTLVESRTQSTSSLRQKGSAPRDTLQKDSPLLPRSVVPGSVLPQTARPSETSQVVRDIPQRPAVVVLPTADSTPLDDFAISTVIVKPSELIDDPSEMQTTSRTATSNASSVSAPTNTSAVINTVSEVQPRLMTAARIGYEIASALHYAHLQGVLHRDVKPSNILVDQHGTSWLSDFGLAKLMNDTSDGTMTEPGDILGTLRYMAPENLKGHADARSDVYSLGITLLELVTLERAFISSDRNELLKLRLSGTRPRIDSLALTAPIDLATIVQKSVEDEPALRYQTAGEMADDLFRYLHDEPIHARRASYLERFSRWARRNKVLATLLTSISLLITLIGISGTIAAGYFQSLNKTLNTTVSNLTIETKKSRELAEEARTARNASQTIVADMQTERGLLALKQGDTPTAMLWFANAATQTPHDPQRQTANRLRAQNAMNESVTPVASIASYSAFTRMRSGEKLRFDFQPDRPSAGQSLDGQGDIRDLLLVVDDGGVQIWDWRSEQMLSWTRENRSLFADACWMPGGDRIAVGLNTGEVQIRKILTGEIVKSFSSKEAVLTIACTSDGMRLVIGGNTVQVWNIGNEPVLEHVWPHPEKVYSLDFDQSNTRLASACSDGFVRVFAIGSQSEQTAPLFNPVPHAFYNPGAPAFLPGQVLVTSNFDRKSNLSHIELRDATTGANIEDIGSTSILVPNRIGVSLDGSWLAIGTYSACELWEIGGNRLTLQHPHHVYDVAFGPNRELLTACVDWNAYLRKSVSSQESPIKIPQMETAHRCAFSAHGSFVAVRGNDFIRVWKLPTPNRVKIPATGWPAAQWRPRVSFDRKRATRGRWHAMPYTMLDELSILDTLTGQNVGPTIHLKGMVDSSLCADGSSVAIISHEDKTGWLSLYNVSSGEKSRPPIELLSLPHSAAARPGHPQVAVLCENGALLVFDTRDGNCLLNLTHPEWLWGSPFDTKGARVTWTHDGSGLITVTFRGEVFVRDGDTGVERFAPIRLKLKQGCCVALDCSADSQFLATAMTGENAVDIWDLKTGAACCPSIPHSGDFWGLFAVKFSPDGQLVFTANKDGRARLWDWRTGKMVCPPLQHDAEVYDVEFIADGKYGLTVDRSDTVHIWELTTGKRIASPIHYPNGEKGFPLSLFNVAVVGDRAVLGAPDFPVLDLSQLVSEPELSTEKLKAIAELSSAHQIALGESNAMTSEQWQELWTRRAQRWLRPQPNGRARLAR